MSNLKSNVQKLDDHPKIAGVSTEHYRLSFSFDMSVMFRSMPLRQAVTTEIDTWTTIEYGDVADTFLATSSLHTGNQQLDDLIDLQTTKLRGLPLKQMVKITTSSLEKALPNSKLALNPIRTQTREMVVTSIHRTNADPSAFVLPASYRRNNDTQSLAQKQAQTQVTVLSFDEGKTQ
jgi:hypothetical protein